MKNFKDYLEELIVKKNNNEEKTLLEISNEVSNKIHCDKHGSCVHFAELFVLEVEKNNPNLLKKFYIIEGYVDTPIGDGVPQEHTWIETLDGKKIDPTFIQFGKNSFYSKKKSRKISALQYLKETKEGSWFSDRRKQFPDKVFKNYLEDVQEETKKDLFSSLDKQDKAEVERLFFIKKIKYSLKPEESKKIEKFLGIKKEKIKKEKNSFTEKDKKTIIEIDKILQNFVISSLNKNRKKEIEDLKKHKQFIQKYFLNDTYSSLYRFSGSHFIINDEFIKKEKEKKYTSWSTKESGANVIKKFYFQKYKNKEGVIFTATNISKKNVLIDISKFYELVKEIIQPKSKYYKMISAEKEVILINFPEENTHKIIKNTGYTE